jgi:hypothetical protein
MPMRLAHSLGVLAPVLLGSIVQRSQFIEHGILPN